MALGSEPVVGRFPLSGPIRLAWERSERGQPEVMQERCNCRESSSMSPRIGSLAVSSAASCVQNNSAPCSCCRAGFVHGKYHEGNAGLAAPRGALEGDCAVPKVIVPSGYGPALMHKSVGRNHLGNGKIGTWTRCCSG